MGRRNLLSPICFRRVHLFLHALHKKTRRLVSSHCACKQNLIWLLLKVLRSPLLCCCDMLADCSKENSDKLIGGCCMKSFEDVLYTPPPPPIYSESKHTHTRAHTSMSSPHINTKHCLLKVAESFHTPNLADVG